MRREASRDFLFIAGLHLAGAVCTNSVKNGAERIYYKTVFCLEMSAQLFKFIAFKMNKAAAKLTLEVKMLFVMIAVFSGIFEAGSRVFIYKILLNQTFVYKLFELTVNCRNSNGDVLFLKMNAYILGCKMLSLHFAKI